MSLSAGISIPRSVLQVRPPIPRPFDTYLRWFIGYGLAGLVYSSFAWSVVLAGSGKSRVELALGLPLKGLIRLLEWVHCPDVVALVLALFPPVTGLACGLAALGACWVWRALGLRWERAMFVILGTALFEAVLVAYACGKATMGDGRLSMPGRGDSMLAMALVVLFAGGLSLVALSPRWMPDTRRASRMLKKS